MPSVQGKPVVRIAPNNPVFDLPVIVGIAEGLFDAAGLDVAFSATYADRENDSAERPVMSRLKEQLFECGSADSYNVCEWASIDRLERGTRGGHIAALRAAVAAQAILTFDESLQVPRDLADVPVVVQELTGSQKGAIRVATLMEPFVSLGLKEGAHFVASCFYRGGEVISPNLTPEQRNAYYAAENDAVDRINADFYKYAHHVTAHAGGALPPHELLRAFVRYKHVDYYDPILFTRTYEWMKARGLAEGGSEHAALVR